jgi:type VI secretion system secreted protein Hcp
MDLILLQPGDPDFLGNNNGWDNGGSLIDDQWRESGLEPGRCIELVSIHQGMKQQITTDVSNSARTSGRPIITEFTCVKYADKSSVRFYDYCLRAQPIGKGPKQATRIYIARNAGDKVANIMTFELRDAIVSEMQFQSHPDDMPTEQFKLNFIEILWSYTVQKTDAAALGKVSTGWSIARNKPIQRFTEDG